MQDTHKISSGIRRDRHHIPPVKAQPGHRKRTDIFISLGIEGGLSGGDYWQSTVSLRPFLGREAG